MIYLGRELGLEGQNLREEREQGEEKQSKASKYISYYYSLLGSLHDYIVPTTDIIVIS